MAILRKRSAGTPSVNQPRQPGIGQMSQRLRSAFPGRTLSALRMSAPTGVARAVMAPAPQPAGINRFARAPRAPLRRAPMSRAPQPSPQPAGINRFARTPRAPLLQPSFAAPTQPTNNRLTTSGAVTGLGGVTGLAGINDVLSSPPASSQAGPSYMMAGDDGVYTPPTPERIEEFNRLYAEQQELLRRQRSQPLSNAAPSVPPSLTDSRMVFDQSLNPEGSAGVYRDMGRQGGVSAGEWLSQPPVYSSLTGRQTIGDGGGGLSAVNTQVVQPRPDFPSAADYANLRQYGETYRYDPNLGWITARDYSPDSTNLVANTPVASALASLPSSRLTDFYVNPIPSPEIPEKGMWELEEELRRAGIRKEDVPVLPIDLTPVPIQAPIQAPAPAPVAVAKSQPPSSGFTDF